MLRANVGLSRKVSRDYQSTGYTVNLDGEIPFLANEPDAVLDKVKELFELAQEAISREIDRDQGEDAIGRRDEKSTTPAPKPQNGSNNGNGQAPKTSPNTGAIPRQEATHNNGGNGSKPSNEEAATNKQVQFLLTMGKRLKLTIPQLKNEIAEVIGRPCGVYDLTKREAGLVLDRLTKAANGEGQAAR